MVANHSNDHVDKNRIKTYLKKQKQKTQLCYYFNVKN